MDILENPPIIDSATPSVLLTALLAFSVQRCSLQKLVVVDGRIHRQYVDPWRVASVWRHGGVNHFPLRGAAELSLQFSLGRAEGTEGTCGPGLERILDLSWEHSWLVVYLPLWKIRKSVGIINPNIWKNKKCSKPPTPDPTYILLPSSYQTWQYMVMEIPGLYGVFPMNWLRGFRRPPHINLTRPGKMNLLVT